MDDTTPKAVPGATIQSKLSRLLTLLGAGTVVVLALLTLLPGPGSRPAGKRSICLSNLKQIAIALHNYHDVYGSFPPAYVADKQGRPMHSWRVLILPYLEYAALYEQYRFDEPWNGPNNIKLVEHVPDVFQCPSNESEGNTCTNYVAVIGPRTAWPERRRSVSGTSPTAPAIPGSWWRLPIPGSPGASRAICT